MPLLPDAHAASLLKREEPARMVFFPLGEEQSCYVVPDVETEQRIFRQLKRIRCVQLACWLSLPVVLISVIAITDGAVRIPKWLVVAVLATTITAVHLLPEGARHRLARGLASASGGAPAPSLIERLPAWVVILVVAAAVGLAFLLRATLAIESNRLA
jgi:hypothetical protein